MFSLSKGTLLLLWYFQRPLRNLCHLSKDSDMVEVRYTFPLPYLIMKDRNKYGSVANRSDGL